MAHQFCHPIQVEEVRPQDRFADCEPEAAPTTPLCTDDGTPAPPDRPGASRDAPAR